MLFGVGAGTVDWIPGSTPLGGVMTPPGSRSFLGTAAKGGAPNGALGGAIFSGGVGPMGGNGPGGAGVADGGLDGWARAADALKAKAATTAMLGPATRRRAVPVPC